MTNKMPTGIRAPLFRAKPGANPLRGAVDHLKDAKAGAHKPLHDMHPKAAHARPAYLRTT